MNTKAAPATLEHSTRFRVQIKHAVAIGPGKADVLEGIAATGSLAETGRRLGMSYQRIWSLVDAMNKDFVEPLVTKQRGGSAGGGARLTATGEQVLALYRAIEEDARLAASRRLPELLALIRPEPEPGSAGEAL
ncbi:MAG: LysR family transcriptional regulator [Methyloversatilis discipulorum]|jgi:molybdate transport system regulatory protein|uniref:winged helix-turn-helix domain-containing protein n=1 Tax=Methyloversatilis discipulorum TaxID=1119528 RepID=UPI0026EEC9AB|nr:LysR family transcriptional regulator [Methyloversatilis discipulorum]MBV5284756.1 LysR family transcriptional regulator [Methyloversatilis discipulorum]